MIKLNEWIFYRIYDGEAFVYNAKYDMYHIFNNSASYILNLIQYISDRNHIVEKLCDKYKISSERAFSDLNNFLSYLKISELICFENDNVDFQNEGYDKDNDGVCKDIYGMMLKKAGEKKLLLSALLEITYRCNLNCIHCYAEPQSQYSKIELSTIEWKSIIDQLYNMNVMFITFSGGEVLMREDFLEIVEYAIKKRFVVDIYTNGTMLSDKLLSKFLELNVRGISFSVYSADTYTHDKITAVSGSLKKTLKSIEQASNLGIRTTLKTVMMKQNCDSYEGIKNLADKYNCNLQTGISISPTITNNIVTIQNRIIDINKIADIICLSESCELPHSREKKDSICGAGFCSISINPYGDIFPCNAITKSCGNVKEGIDKVWENSSFLKEIRKTSLFKNKNCKKCKDKDYCQFCLGVSLSQNNKIDAYDEACLHTQARKIAIKRKLEKFNNTI